jgi:hypothetical protein
VREGKTCCRPFHVHLADDELEATIDVELRVLHSLTN